MYFAMKEVFCAHSGWQKLFASGRRGEGYLFSVKIDIHLTKPAKTVVTPTLEKQEGIWAQGLRNTPPGKVLTRP